MDKSIVAAEDTRVGNESLVSPVQINSIAIDLDCAMGDTTQSLTHEHFSILGFTAEMRKKDRKVCFPFAADMNLPPLPVPKFRRWQCSECLSEMRKKDSESTPEVIVAAKSCAGSSSVHNTIEEDIDADVRNSEGGNLFPHITTEANQIQTKQITRNNSADENPSTGPHSPGKASSPSDGDIPFSSVPLKRKPKLRSLADIIKEDDNSIPAQQIEPELDPQDRLNAPKRGAAKTLHKRKKIVLEDEDEEEGEETGHPIATAKRSKGPVIESSNNNTTSRSIEISESESERDNSRPLLKTNQNKARKQRSPDINRKNLHKDPPVAAETSIADTGLFFKNYLFGEQMHRISDMSKGKRVEEGGYSPYTPPMSNDGSLGVCNNHEKVSLDLSLSSYKGSGVKNSEKQECSGRHTEIPDLNESFVEKTSMTMDEPQLPTLHENSNMFFPSGKEGNNTVEAEPSGKASDDIPMEIVELLAKNQHERSLSNSGKHLGIYSNNPFKVMSPDTFNFPCTNSGGQFRQFGPPMPDQHRTGLHSGPMNMSHADLLWPPRRKNMSFGLSQSSGLEGQSCKVKNVKTAVTDWTFDVSQPSCRPGSSMDVYSNDMIPAMQLLSLMDQRNDPSSSFFGQRQSNGSNDFPTLLNGARCSGNFSSKNIFSLGKVLPPQKGNSKPAGPRYISARPWRSNFALEVCCTLNRNPADFSAPDARNEFMISAKDLKLMKRKRRVGYGNDRLRRGNN